MQSPLLTPTLLALAAWVPVAVPAGSQDEPAQPPEKPYHVGSKVIDELVLVDLAGRERRLFEECDEKAFVLVFWSLRDPLSHAYAKRLVALDAALAKQGVELFLIDANHDEIVAREPDPVDKIREHLKEEELALDVLLDRGNVVADDFAALCANHAFVIDARRFLRYSGAIDDDPRGTRPAEERRTWLADAVEAVLAGNEVEHALTRPKGRPIKRAPASADKQDGGGAGE